MKLEVALTICTVARILYSLGSASPVAGMKSSHVARAAKPRYPRIGFLKVAFLSIFLPSGWSQDRPGCDSGIQLLTVASTNDAVTLTSSLECSNGTFVVEWFGKVIVSETITIAEGTSVNITGATGDATADGNHTTQLFVVHGASSSLCFTDMVLTNGQGGSGGAVRALDQAHISFGGNTTFTANRARYGGAIFADSSSVFWNGEKTTFSNNYASYYGGAIMAAGTSSVSWEDETIFIDNSAFYRGGAVFANQSSISWQGTTSVLGNSAYDGGGIMVESSSDVSWGGETIFMNNNATHWGGGIIVAFNSDVLWTGNTTFLSNNALDGGGLFIFDTSVGAWSGTTTFKNNTAGYTGGGLVVHTRSKAFSTDATTFTSNVASRGGAVFVWSSIISWSGSTTFSQNIAYTDGGAVYATVGSDVYCNGLTAFRNNVATAGNGGALGLYAFGSSVGSYANFSGETTFANNIASVNGGAVFSSANPQGQDYQGVIFQSNSAGIGGAVATFGTGNNDETTVASATTFSGCDFINNTATETGGAIESAFGQEKISSSHFENNSADVGGALRVGGKTAIVGCSFISNMASSSGLAVAAVGYVEINESSFDGNVFVCGEGEFLHAIKGTVDTARYDSACRGCPSWEDCQSCTVRENSSEPICSMELEHTTADISGRTLETLSIDKGYWRTTKSSAIILACYNPDACEGGQTGTVNFCNNGYSGAYCSVCRSGYSSSLSRTCTRCTPSRRQWLVAITVIAGIIAVCAMAVFSQYLVSKNFEERETTSIHQRILRRAPLQAFKSVLVVWQILTQFASVANVTYPGVYQTFLNGLDFINLDVGFVLSAGCLWLDIDFHDRVIAGTIWPLVILGWLAMTYAIALHRNAGSDDSVRQKIRHKHLTAVLYLLFFVYSSVSSVVFQMFACDALDDGEEYLRADYRILCTDQKHRNLQIYAGFMVAVYPVGIPLLFGVLLYRHREVLSDSVADKTAAMSISSLWAPYRPNRFFYEVVECARRIMLTGVVVFIYPNDTAQIAITIMNAFFFFGVAEVLRPYESVSDTWVSRCGHVLIFFSMFDVLLLRVDVSQESSESQHVLAGVLVAGHVVMIMTAVAESIGLWFAARQKARVVEENTPSRRALRRPRICVGQKEA